MGGDHGHGHGHGRMELPDWRQWKVDGTPLELTRQRLAARGLKDPWLRNEAWRYSAAFGQPATFSQVIFRGFKYGFAAFSVALAIEYAFFSKEKSDH